MSEKIPDPNALSDTNSEGPEKRRRTVDFLIGGEVKSFDREAKVAELGVVDIVRMQPEDFPTTLFVLPIHINPERIHTICCKREQIEVY